MITRDAAIYADLERVADLLWQAIERNERDNARAQFSRLKRQAQLAAKFMVFWAVEREFLPTKLAKALISNELTRATGGKS